MSINALKYVLDYTKLGNNLLLYYNFETGSYISPFGWIPNNYPAVNTNLYSGIVTYANDENELFNNFLEPNGSGNFAFSNVEIYNGINCNFNNISILIDFEQNGTDSSILFGSFDPFLQDEIIGTSGFNWGINSYGRMFFQHVSSSQHYIYNSDIDLSQKNIVSISVSDTHVDINRHDYGRKLIETNTFLLNGSSLINSQQAYLGGAKSFYRSLNQSQPTLSGWMGNVLIFSGYLPSSKLFSIGSGLISNYTYTPETSKTISVITGFETIPVYPNDITGYLINYSVDNKNIEGEIKNFEGSFAVNSISEGENFITGSLIGSDYFIEKKAFLADLSPFEYSPTGDEPIDTLGLQEISENRNVFTSSVSFTSPDQTGWLSYSVSPLIGVSSEPTGYLQTGLYEDVIVQIPASSGIEPINELIKLYNFNYLYYEEIRP